MCNPYSQDSIQSGGLSYKLINSRFNSGCANRKTLNWSLVSSNNSRFYSSKLWEVSLEPWFHRWASGPSTNELSLWVGIKIQYCRRWKCLLEGVGTLRDELDSVEVSQSSKNLAAAPLSMQLTWLPVLMKTEPGFIFSWAWTALCSIALTRASKDCWTKPGEVTW